MNDLDISPYDLQYEREKGFLRGAMFVLAEFSQYEGELSSEGVAHLARSCGTWEDFKEACDEYDLRRFARFVKQRGIKEMRSCLTSTN